MASKAERREAKRRRRQGPSEAKRVKAKAVTLRRTSRLMPAPDWVDTDLPWYVVRAETRREARAERELVEAGIDAWLPRVEVTSEVRGREIRVERALFPGYLLVSVESDDSAESRKRADRVFAYLPGYEAVLGVVGSPSGMGTVRPSRLPRRFVELLARRIADDASAPEPAPETLKAGESVRITEGPFAAFVGIVARVMPDLGKIMIEADIFGRSTPLTLDVAHVAPVEA